MQTPRDPLGRIRRRIASVGRVLKIDYMARNENNECKHVGVIVNVNGNENSEARARVAAAGHAYFPLAPRLFGVVRVEMWLQLSFADSLVFSRLF